MEEQSYAKHTKFVPLFHGVLAGIIFLTLLCSFYGIYRAIDNGHGRIDAVLITALSFAALLLFWFCRIFPLKAQDRAIRAEENLRHFAMTGKLLDPRLTVPQIVALRFASDAEFLALAQLAAKNNMKSADIKGAVKNWRADNYRV